MNRFATELIPAHMPIESDRDILRIVIATDCHLGYDESHPITGEDSFTAFEEVLSSAVEKRADIILLSGDLFHHNNPSQRTMNKCVQLLRQYTFGHQQVRIELLSKETSTDSGLHVFNFLDNNLNVSIPVFSIHGNHDDPSGYDHKSSMDTLSSAGLVNYFGKCTDMSKVIVKPLVLKKGNTFVALYGLGYMKDDRLCRLFMENRVKFLEPEFVPEKCFRILLLHQNRAERGPKRFISESFLPSFFDFVIWGHEHDCEIKPEWNIEKEFFVVQPGSTVATSLCEGEAKAKHIGILHLCEYHFRFLPIKLNTVRPFIWKTVDLNKVPIPDSEPGKEKLKKSDIIKSFCIEEINKMIIEAKSLLTGHPKQPELPLIRLRCEYSDESQLFNVVKLGQEYLDRVANPSSEIIRFKKIFDTSKKREPTARSEVLKSLKEMYGEKMYDNLSFSEYFNGLIRDYFVESQDSQMDILNPKEMEEALEKFMEKDEMDIIDSVVNKRKDKVLGLLSSHVFEDEEAIRREFERLRNAEKVEAEKEEKILAGSERKNKVGEREKVVEVVDESSSGTEEYEFTDGEKAEGRGENTEGKEESEEDREENYNIVTETGFKKKIFSGTESESHDSDEELRGSNSFRRGGARGRGRKGRNTGGGRGRGRGRGRGANKEEDSGSEKKTKKLPLKKKENHAPELDFVSSISIEDFDSDF